MSIKHCFVVTSAVNSKFGVYSPAARLQQTPRPADNEKGAMVMGRLMGDRERRAYFFFEEEPAFVVD